MLYLLPLPLLALERQFQCEQISLLYWLRYFLQAHCVCSDNNNDWRLRWKHFLVSPSIYTCICVCVCGFDMTLLILQWLLALRTDHYSIDSSVGFSNASGSLPSTFAASESPERLFFHCSAWCVHQTCAIVALAWH